MELQFRYNTKSNSTKCHCHMKAIASLRIATFCSKKQELLFH